MAIPLVVSIVGDTKGLAKALDQSGKDATGFGAKFNAGTVLKVAAFAGVAVKAIDALHDLAQASRQDALEADKLALAVESAGAAHGNWAAQIDAAIAKGQDLIFTDTQIRDSLAALVAVTGDVGIATEQMALAQDLARLKNVDLQTATDAVAKAYDGSAGSLGKLLKISTEGMTATEVLAEAQRLGAGQADLYGDAQVNAADKMKIKVDEAGESFGALVAQVEDALMGAFSGFIGWLDEIGGEGGAAAAFKRGLDKVATVVGIFLTAIDKVLQIFRDVAGAIGWAIDKLAEFARKLHDFLFGQDMRSVRGGALSDMVNGPSLGGLGLLPPGYAGGPAGGETTININTGADAEDVVRALVRWTSRNGGPGALTRVLER